MKIAKYRNILTTKRQIQLSVHIISESSHNLIPNNATNEAALIFGALRYSLEVFVNGLACLLMRPKNLIFKSSMMSDCIAIVRPDTFSSVYTTTIGSNQLKSVGAPCVTVTSLEAGEA